MTLNSTSYHLEEEAAASAAPELRPAHRALTEVERKGIVDTYDALRRNVPNFRSRRAQAHMIAAASRALGNDGGAAVLEAGTGTGKSLAYLTAGMTLATMHEKTLLIATGTVGLQEQLTARDIPMFTEATRIEGSAVLAKGRSRYACPRNMAALASTSGDQGSLALGADDDLAEGGAWPRPPRKGEAERVQKLAARLQSRSWDGDLDNPPLKIDDQLRPLLSTTAGACAGRRCEQYMACPFFHARRALDDARVVVVNHALLMADLQFPRGDEASGFGGVLLPKLEDCLVVIDEGHQLPHTAISASAASCHLTSTIRRVVRWQGFLNSAYRALGKDEIAGASSRDAAQMTIQISDALRSLEATIRSMWVPNPADGAYAVYRGRMGEVPAEWRDGAAHALCEVERLLKVVVSLRRRLSEKAEDLDAGARQVLPREVGLIFEQLTEAASVLRWWSLPAPSKPTAPPVARWVQLAGPRDTGLVISASPVSAADVLRERLFDQAAGVVVTSATLSAGGDFTKVLRDLGAPRHTETMSLPSPFDYEGQAVLQVPWIAASATDQERHAREIADWMMRELDHTAGNLVLFNSKAKLNRVMELLEGPLKAVTRSQYEMPKSELLATHAAAVQAGTGSTLLGSWGLGEGTDLRGDLCSTLVVTALPFRPPTDPVEATYAEWLEAQGRRPFDEVTVPGTIRVLTQFVGRLLRHEDDRGRVVILDRRIVDTRYGRRILDALPPFRREIAPKAVAGARRKPVGPRAPP